MRTCALYIFMFSAFVYSADGYAFTCGMKYNAFNKGLKRVRESLAFAKDTRGGFSTGALGDAAEGGAKTGVQRNQAASGAIATNAQKCANELDKTSEALSKYIRSCNKQGQNPNVIAQVKQANNTWNTFLQNNKEDIASLCSKTGAASYANNAGDMAELSGYNDAVKTGNGDSFGGKVKGAAKKYGPTALVGAGAGLLAYSLLKDDDDDNRQPASNNQDESEDPDSTEPDTGSASVGSDEPDVSTAQISPIAEQPSENTTDTAGATQGPSNNDPSVTGVPSNNEGDQSGQRDQTTTAELIDQNCLGEGAGAVQNCEGSGTISISAATENTLTNATVATIDGVQGSRGLASLSEKERAFYQKHGFLMSQIPQKCLVASQSATIACAKKHLGLD